MQTSRHANISAHWQLIPKTEERTFFCFSLFYHVSFMPCDMHSFIETSKLSQTLSLLDISNLLMSVLCLHLFWSPSTVSPPQPFPLQLCRGISGSGSRENHESSGVSPLLIQPKASTVQQGRDCDCTGPGATQRLAVRSHWQQPTVGSPHRRLR